MIYESIVFVKICVHKTPLIHPFLKNHYNRIGIFVFLVVELFTDSYFCKE